METKVKKIPQHSSLLGTLLSSEGFFFLFWVTSQPAGCFVLVLALYAGEQSQRRVPSWGALVLFGAHFWGREIGNHSKSNFHFPLYHLVFVNPSEEGFHPFFWQTGVYNFLLRWFKTGSFPSNHGHNFEEAVAITNSSPEAENSFLLNYKLTHTQELLQFVLLRQLCEVAPGTGRLSPLEMSCKESCKCFSFLCARFLWTVEYKAIFWPKECYFFPPRIKMNPC